MTRIFHKFVLTTNTVATGWLDEGKTFFLVKKPETTFTRLSKKGITLWGKQKKQ